MLCCIALAMCCVGQGQTAVHVDTFKYQMNELAWPIVLDIVNRIRKYRQAVT